MKTIGIFFTFLLLSSAIFAQESDTPSLLSQYEDETYRQLSLAEWKKFKSFEKKLAIQNAKEKSQQLKGYVKDSIQILGVKLIAVKLLNEKQLLDQDITENPGYYSALLDELRESGIPQREYLFLEEKMAFVRQDKLEQQLGQSRWLNIALVVLSLGLLYGVFRLRRNIQRPVLPELSKQELTVQNLILEGKSNKEIANELFISLSTVKSHITNLYAKLNVANRQELFQKSTGTST